MSARAARVDDALGNTLMVEMEDFLAKDEIFQQGRTTLASAERILIIRDAMTEIVDRKSTRLTPVTNAHLVCRLLLEKKKQPKKKPPQQQTTHDTNNTAHKPQPSSTIHI